jgi:FdhD protein
MRTPGDDAALAAGFLFSEGVVRTAADITEVRDIGEAIDVRLSEACGERLPELLAGRRQVTMNSSCGMCGRPTLESVRLDAAPLDVQWRVPAATILTLPDVLRRAQAAFTETGGLHASGVFDLTGTPEATAEDVGRHNAVDKLVGRMLRAGRLPLADRLLFVSGRSSFEIVQKAWLAGIPLIAGVSAPSSLAIELADRAGITLAGFVRGGRFNIYTHPARVVTPPTPPR